MIHSRNCPDMGAFEFDPGWVDDSEAGLPQSVVLYQNYPNPFNAVTKISYGMPETARLSIQVYDLAGRLVATVADGEFIAGYHSVLWNASLATSGIYIVTFETETEMRLIKVLLVR